MSTGGVTDNYHTIEIQGDAVGHKLREVVDTSSNIVQCGRPPCLGRSQATVFQVPDCEAARHEIISQRNHLVAAVRHSPKPAMEQADHGRPWCCRQMQITLLSGQRPVPDGLQR